MSTRTLTNAGPRSRSALACIAPLVALALLSSCSTPQRMVGGNGPDELGVFGRSSDTAAAERAFQAESYPLAREMWRRGITPINRTDDSYLTRRLYQTVGGAYANIAYTHLVQGNPTEARIAFEQSFQTVQDGETRLERLLEQRQQARQELMEALTVFSSVALGLAAVRAPDLIAANAYRNVAYALPQITLTSNRTAEPTNRYIQGGGVTGDSVRMPVMPTGYQPFWNIGRFESSSGHCTASLVGYRVAITNAHCVVPDKGRSGSVSPAARSAKFVLENVLFRWSIPVDEVHTHQGGYWDGRTENDWAILVLPYHPENFGALVVFPAWSNSENNPLAISGYSGDLNDGRYQTMDWGCNMLWNYRSSADNSQQHAMQANPLYGEKTVGYACRTAPGSSGSPVFNMILRRNRVLLGVVGLHARSNGQSGFGPAAASFYESLKEVERRVLSTVVANPDEERINVLNDNKYKKTVLDHIQHRLFGY